MKAAFAGALMAALLLGLPAWADEPGVPAGDAQVGGALDLSIRARALGLVPEPHAAGTLGLEPMRAPTGAGTTRMPSAATGRERGVYLSVVVCDPDGVERVYTVRMDDAGTLPEGPLRTGAPGPRGLYLPGRPIP